MKFLRRRYQNLMSRPISTSLRVAIVLLTFVGTLVTVTDLMPAPLSGVYLVEASCAAIPGASLYQQAEEETESFTITLTLPDGTPLVGVCLTFTRDRGPGVPPEIVAQCTTDETGSCTVQIPGGVITVNFGNTRIGGVDVDSSQSEHTDNLDDASPGGLTFYFPAEQPAEEPVVATPGDGGTITVDHATTDENGNPAPLPGNPTTEWPDIPPDFESETHGGIEPPTEGELLSLPEGTVTVRFTPGILQTGSSYDKAYCYYATRAGGYARAPADSGTFLPGGGQYFDLGAVLSGESRPAQILVAEEQTFDMVLQCWGWQGDNLEQIGIGSLTEAREQWLGQSINLGGNGFVLNYALLWDGPETQPQNPRLPILDVLDDSVGLSELPDLADRDGFVAAPRNRFTDELESPGNVVLENNQLNWSYNEDRPIGGFRIYRNGYLVGRAAVDARAWTGDGLTVAECGNPIQYTVTAYSGGQESLPSSEATVDAPDCVAEITVTLDQLGFANVSDCDGTTCGQSPEIYGFVTVNDSTVFFGGGGSSPQYTAIKDGQTFDFAGLLGVFGESNQITVNIGSDEGLTIEVALFDHDAETADDILCTWQEILPSRDAEGWQSQNERKISRDGGAGEAECNISVTLTIE